MFHNICNIFIEQTEIPAAPPVIKEEPEKIKKWREEQKARLEQKGTIKIKTLKIIFLKLQKIFY